MTGFRGDVIHSYLKATAPTFVVNSISYTTLDDADLTEDYIFSRVLEYHVNVSISEMTSNSNAGTIKSKAGQTVYHLTLSNRWNIPVNCAKQTVTKTTQRGVRTCLTPYFSRIFPTNDRMLRYDRLPHTFFSDTLIAGSVSKRGKKYAQIYGASFGWAQVFTMAKKGNTHETLSLIFERDGAPPKLIVYGSKLQISGKFNKKLKETNCHLRQTNPESPWSNATDWTICETKSLS